MEPAAPTPDRADGHTPQQLEAGRLLFAGPCSFERPVGTLDQLPEPGLPEVAFAGRSNVGKSSLVNALTGRKTLARTSNTPGRTQALIFFDLAGRLRLVDMPGYGYAKVSKSLSRQWTAVMRDYLRGRVPLRRVVLLIDARHGLKDSDTESLTLLDTSAVPCQVVMTKADKLKPGALAAVSERVAAALTKHPAAGPHVLATSARSGLGIDVLRADLALLASGG